MSKQPLYIIEDADTGERLEGIPSPMLLDATNTEATPEAWQQRKGQWRYVQPSERKRAEKSRLGIRRVRIRQNPDHYLVKAGGW